MQGIGLAAAMVVAAGTGFVPEALAQKAGVPVLKPAGAWAIDYAKDSCGVSRRYGTGADQVEMVFITLPRSSGATLAFVMSAEKGPGPERANFGRVRIKLGAEGKGFIEDYASAPLGNTGRRFVYVRLDQEQLDRIVATDRIRVDAGAALRVDIEPGRTANAFKALEPCHMDLVKSWKLDPEILRTAVNRAAPGKAPQRWVTNSDYPLAALQKGEQGTSTFRLTVGIDGKVAECALLNSSGSAALDGAVCDLLRKRASFKPARDAAGKPVPDLWISRFRWELPR